MSDIICPECNHSLSEHYEDYDGGGGCNKCERLYPDNPNDPDCDNILNWCHQRPESLKLEIAIELLEKYMISETGVVHKDIVEFLEEIK